MKRTALSLIFVFGTIQLVLGQTPTPSPTPSPQRPINKESVQQRIVRDVPSGGDAEIRRQNAVESELPAGSREAESRATRSDSTADDDIVTVDCAL